VSIELLVITAAFTRNELYRVSIGIAALALLAGFYLFMGVFWPGWWILLLGFLPWQRLSVAQYRRGVARLAPPTRPVRGGATAAQLALIVFVLLQQIVVSAFAIERAPMFSHYPMYSVTHASPAAFNAARRPLHRIVVTTGDTVVELSCNASGDLVEDFQAALRGSPEASATVWRAVGACRPDLANAPQVTFYEESRVFDWERLVFTTVPRVELGTLAAAERAP
jgi:hypothetical protein